MKALIETIKSKIKGWLGLDRGPSFTDLIERGLTVGKNFSRQPECILDPSHCWLISIGDNVTLAPRVYILAYDASTKRELGYTKIGLVTIGNNVFIGANTTVLPGVTIGDNTVIGANCLVSKSIPANSVVSGNPAKVTASYDDYMDKSKMLFETRPYYDQSFTLEGGITDDQKRLMLRELEDGIGFVE